MIYWKYPLNILRKINSNLVWDENKKWDKWLFHQFAGMYAVKREKYSVEKWRRLSLIYFIHWQCNEIFKLSFFKSIYRFNDKTILVMMNILHEKKAFNVIECSINYVKISHQENESEDCSVRRDLLRSVFDYDEKIQIYCNQLHYKNTDISCSILTQDEKVIRDLFKSWYWAIFRNHFDWEIKKSMDWELWCSK